MAGVEAAEGRKKKTARQGMRKWATVGFWPHGFGCYWVPQ